MNYAELLLHRLRVVEQIHIRRAVTEPQVTHLYYQFQSELSGGNLRGGTVEDGIEEMKWIHAQLMSPRFAELSKNS